MGGSGIEKRRDPRVFFANENVLSAGVQLNHGNLSLAGDVLNLSVGGVQFSFKRQDSLHVIAGDKLTLQTLVGRDELAGLVGSAMEVRWVLDHEFLDHIAVGCEFVGLAEEQQGSLQLVVDSFLAQQ